MKWSESCTLEFLEWERNILDCPEFADVVKMFILQPVILQVPEFTPRDQFLINHKKKLLSNFSLLLQQGGINYLYEKHNRKEITYKNSIGRVEWPPERRI